MTKCDKILKIEDNGFPVLTAYYTITSFKGGMVVVLKMKPDVESLPMG